MKRRTSLSLLGSALIGITAGCLTTPSSDQEDSGDDEDCQLQHKVRYSMDPNDVKLIKSGLGHESGAELYYVTLLVDTVDTERFNYEYMEDQEDVDDEVIAFIQDTDFEEAYFVVI